MNVSTRGLKKLK